MRKQVRIDYLEMTILVVSDDNDYQVALPRMEPSLLLLLPVLKSQNSPFFAVGPLELVIMGCVGGHTVLDSCGHGPIHVSV